MSGALNSAGKPLLEKPMEAGHYSTHSQGRLSHRRDDSLTDKRMSEVNLSSNYSAALPGALRIRNNSEARRSEFD